MLIRTYGSRLFDTAAQLLVLKLCCANRRAKCFISIERRREVVTNFRVQDRKQIGDKRLAEKLAKVSQKFNVEHTQC